MTEPGKPGGGRASLPPKLYFRIGEVANLVGVEPHVLRYWEREFRTIRPTKSAKGHRVYSRRDVENLMRVRELLYAEGFTIAGAKKRLLRPGVAGQAGAHASAAERAREQNREDAPRKAEAPSADAGAQVERHANVKAIEGRELATNGAARAPARMREKLKALRAEVESFLQELGG